MVRIAMQEPRGQRDFGVFCVHAAFREDYPAQRRMYCRISLNLSIGGYLVMNRVTVRNPSAASVWLNVNDRVVEVPGGAIWSGCKPKSTIGKR